jgi:adenine-specific DNA methylase
VARVATWDDLLARDRAVMVLNGDSARLPVPDASIDAVVTDPPYFDFVHYSELSDFFFAWLSPVLAQRYPWMQRPDSSDKGEVQHKDPHVFARQLSLVFAECRRVLKDDGVLAFSFHHSRAEGWAAIYEAVKNAGFEVVAAHPVHAELRGASPKNATKSPISIDAILVCKKHTMAEHRLSERAAIDEAEKLVSRLESNGYRVLSRTLRARDNGAADSIRCLRGAKRRTTPRIKPTSGRESLRLSALRGLSAAPLGRRKRSRHWKMHEGEHHFSPSGSTSRRPRRTT